MEAQRKARRFPVPLFEGILPLDRSRIPVDVLGGVTRASLCYANANRFTEEVHGIVTAAKPPVTWLCLDAAAISDIDYSAAQTLRETQVELGKQGVGVVLADVQDPVREELDRYGITELVGADAYYATVAEAIAGFSRSGGH